MQHIAAQQAAGPDSGQCSLSILISASFASSLNIQ